MPGRSNRPNEKKLATFAVNVLGKIASKRDAFRPKRCLIAVRSPSILKIPSEEELRYGFFANGFKIGAPSDIQPQDEHIA